MSKNIHFLYQDSYQTPPPSSMDNSATAHKHHLEHNKATASKRHQAKIHAGEWSEHLDGFSSLHSHLHTSQDACSLLWDMFEVPVLLVLVGVVSALISCLTNLVINYGNSIRYTLISTPTDYVSWLCYCLWCLGFSLLACFFTTSICREAAGSGLPEMKTILSGVIKPILLSFSLVTAKILGLICSFIGGLSVGKEGPFVQISGAIADLMMRWPIFRHIHQEDRKRLEIIACACASGVGATFGTAFGGVLFSIELTASAYLVRTLPKAFLSSVCAMLVISYLQVHDQVALFEQPQNVTMLISMQTPNYYEILAFLCLGLLSGMLGVVFVMLVETLSMFRNHLLDSKQSSDAVVNARRYLMVAVVSLLVSVPLYYEFASILSTYGNTKTLLEHLFQQQEMKVTSNTLIPYFFYKFVATALSVTLPLPVGLFTPVFLAGGVLGRIVGEKFCQFAAFSNFSPWEYAILGAAGFSTGVTRAISTAVIVYELCGQPHLRLPLSVVVLTAYFVGNRFSKNVYEVLIDTNGTPYLPEIPKDMYNVPVSKVMMPITAQHVLALNSTYEEAVELLSAMEDHAAHSSVSTTAISENEEDTLLQDMTTNNVFQAEQHTHSTKLHVQQPQLDPNLPPKLVRYCPSVIPVVKSKKSMVIVGAILRADLEKTVSRLKNIIRVARKPPVVLGNFDEEVGEERNSVPYSIHPVFRTPTSHSAVIVEEDDMEQQHNKHHHHHNYQQHVDNATIPGLIGYQHNADAFAHDYLQEPIQYILVTNGGRSIVPIASSATTTGTPISSISWRSLPLAITLDPSPYQVVDTMQLNKVDMLFRMLSLNQAYVTNSGKLVGIITRASLRECLGSFQRRPLDRCRQLFRAVLQLLRGHKGKHGYEELSSRSEDFDILH